MPDDAGRISLPVGVICLHVHWKLKSQLILEHRCDNSCYMYVGSANALWVSSLHAAKWDNSKKVLKINNKHQMKVWAHFVFPGLQIHCSCISNRFGFFHSKIKAYFFPSPKSEMSSFECRVLLWCLSNISNLDLWRPSSVSLLGCPG